MSAHPPRRAPQSARQRGQAMLLTVLLLGVGVSAVIYNFVAPAKQSIERDRITAAALAQAKEALIGRAAADAVRPGSLSCPDTNNDGNAESPVAFGGVCPSYIGRVPWRTLGLPDLRDGSGERLWYALTPAFRDHPTGGVLNSDTPGQLTITGTAAANNVIAIIFAPGPVLGAQVRDTANENNVANYLEGENANGDTFYATALATAAFNDKLLPITSDALFNVVNIRVARAAIAALESYRGTNNYYPFANNHDAVGAPYSCTGNVIRGRFPATTAGCGQAAWGALPAWWVTNNWSQVTHYALSTTCGQLGMGVADALLIVACDLLGNLSLSLAAVNAALTLAGFPPLVDEPVTVAGVAANAKALVIVTGRGTPYGQIHPCTSAGQCMEDAQNTDGDTVYARPSRFPAANDRMVVCVPAGAGIACSAIVL